MTQEPTPTWENVHTHIIGIDEYSPAQARAIADAIHSVDMEPAS